MDRLIPRPQYQSLRGVNGGSVGLPFDGDPRVCYALISNLTTEPAGPAQIELRRVAYNIETTVEQFYASDYPAADISAYNLRTALSMGNSLIYTPEMRRSGMIPEQS